MNKRMNISEEAARLLDRVEGIAHDIGDFRVDLTMDERARIRINTKEDEAKVRAALRDGGVWSHQFVIRFNDLFSALEKLYQRFIERDENTAPEKMASWLQSAGVETGKDLARINREFAEAGIDLRNELDKLVDQLKADIVDEQIAAVVYSEPRDNDAIYRNFIQLAHVISLLAAPTADFE